MMMFSTLFSVVLLCVEVSFALVVDGNEVEVVGREKRWFRALPRSVES